MTDLRTSIQSSLQDFVALPLREASLELLATLGYRSDKTVELAGSQPKAFLDFIAEHNPDAAFDQKKALVADWKSADLLFQLTDDELSGERSLFEDAEVKPALLKSYLFFAIELNGDSAVNGSYARGKLTAIARQINRVFPMPVMLLIKHPQQKEEVLSIAVINRRQNKISKEKDVLGKVTIIRDISLTQEAHRGHKDILNSIAFENLIHPEKKPIVDFDTLHTAWERIFNVELLNKNFYDELANWFFWAKKHSRFPLYDPKADKYDLFHDSEKAKEHEAKNLIRLLTRTLFVWFIKERGLVPGSFFSPPDLKKTILKSFDPESSDTNYYKAVLQNLFFATLNQTHGEREFRKEGQHQNTTTLLRYKDYLASPAEFVQVLEDSTPFLNGGLFECLDRPHPTKKGPQGGKVIIYEDGFSDRKDNPLQLPDFLFFGKERTDDLSEKDSFGLTSKRNAKVRGLIHILDSYKFTIVENTPIDQEIALDPELLGQVFENLLASYNPETKTTARKQTGSFYTPRPIVDYMVDESLKAYLKGALVEKAGMTEAGAKEGLDILFAYTEKEHAFTPIEVATLIRAIDSCRILDPACGSGAFPMGALQKLVYVLSKLDPGDELWEKRQLAKVDIMIEAAHDIDDTTFRERAIADAQDQKKDIEEAFAKNELGYGRKLYLIENCLYGVDIQSIATQVTKLRFFISLIVDQTVDRKRENFGVRPLPNLETKFVTADSLIQVERPRNQGELFEIAEVSSLQRELKQVRHSLFSAKTSRTKNKYRERDKELRDAIAEELKENGWTSDDAEKLAAWDPYDQNASTPYFDPEWMFGLKLFDIIIGNPPYVFGGNVGISDANKKLYKQIYVSGSGKINLFTIFIERGSQLLNPEGILSYILPNTLLRVTSYKAIRNHIIKTLKIAEILDLDVGVFDKVTASTIVIRLIQEKPHKDSRTLIKHGLEDVATKFSRQLDWLASGGIIDIFSSQQDRDILTQIVSGSCPLGDLCHRIRFGVVISGNLAEVVSDTALSEQWKPFLEGDEIGPYTLNYQGRFLNYDESLLHRSRTPDIFECRKIMIQRITGGQTPIKATLDDGWFYNKESILNLILKPQHSDKYEFFLALINSKLVNWFYRKRFTNDSKLTVNLSKEYLEQIPIKYPASSGIEIFPPLVTLILFARRNNVMTPAQFLVDLIDACVMECYFREHMAERDLLFHDTVAQHIAAYDPKASEAMQRDFLIHLHATLNTPSHPIRNRLLRLTTDSPDLLAIIKQEGKV